MNRIPGRCWSMLCLALVLSACGDAAPTAPAAPQFGAGNGPDVSWIAQYSNGAPTLTIAWAKAWIGPEGGSLRLLDFEIVVPPGAVARTTRFGIRLPVDPKSSTHALAEFEPHNVTFAVPVTLRLPYAGTTAENSTSSVLWWSGGTWVAYPTIVLPDGRLETTTTHFSTYGTEEPKRGIIVLGG